MLCWGLQPVEIHVGNMWKCQQNRYQGDVPGHDVLRFGVGDNACLMFQTSDDDDRCGVQIPPYPSSFPHLRGTGVPSVRIIFI